MADFPNNNTTMSDDETAPNIKILFRNLRIDGNFAKNQPHSLNVAKFLHSLFLTWQDADKFLQIKDVNGSLIDLDNFPSSKEAFDEKFGISVQDRAHSRKVIMVVTIGSQLKFHTLKHKVYNKLVEAGMFLNQHKMEINTLDCAFTGWLFKENPKFHSIAVLKDEMIKEMEGWWSTLTEAEKAKWGFEVNDNLVKLPDFVLVHRPVYGFSNSISSKSEAFHVQTQYKDAQKFNAVMGQVFPPALQPGVEHAIRHVPLSLKKAESGVYLELVQRQQEFMNRHQNIAVAGISVTNMEEEFQVTLPNGATDQMTIREAFLSNDNIDRLCPTRRQEDLGKWNLSTTKEKAPAAKAWVDRILAALPDHLKFDSIFPDFPEATRLQARARPARPAKPPNAWTTELGGVSPETQKARQTAWPPFKPTLGPRHNPQEPLDMSYSLEAATPTTSYAQAATPAHTRTPPPAAVTAAETSQMSSLAASTQQAQAMAETAQTQVQTLTSTTEGLTTSLGKIMEMMAEEKKERALARQEDKLERAAERKSIFTHMDNVGSEVAKSTAASNQQIQDLQEENAKLRHSMEELVNRMNSLEDDRSAQAPSPIRKKRTTPRQTEQERPPVSITPPARLDHTFFTQPPSPPEPDDFMQTDSMQTDIPPAPGGGGS